MSKLNSIIRIHERLGTIAQRYDIDNLEQAMEEIRAEITRTDNDVIDTAIFVKEKYLDENIERLKEYRNKIDNEIKRLEKFKEFVAKVIYRYVSEFHDGCMLFTHPITNMQQFIVCRPRMRHQINNEKAREYVGKVGRVMLKLDVEQFNEIVKAFPNVQDIAEPIINVTDILDKDEFHNALITEFVEDISITKRPPRDKL